MIDIPGAGNSFVRPYQGLNGPWLITAQPAEVAWAALTVGRRSSPHVLRHGIFSVYEAIYRLFMVYANLRFQQRAIASDAYGSLDPSEKRAVSYFLGMTFAKLFASRQLGCAQLLHLDVYRQWLRATTPGTRRPDLVGPMGPRRWCAIEVKGRTGKAPKGLLAAAKRQVAGGIWIRGRPVSLSVALVAHFPKGSVELAVLDPPPRGEVTGSQDLTVDMTSALRQYYDLPMRLAAWGDDRQETVEGRVFQMISVPFADVEVGFDVEVERRLNARQMSAIFEMNEGAVHLEETFIGPDGVLVRLGRSWEPDQLAQEPGSRTAAGVWPQQTRR